MPSGGKFCVLDFTKIRFILAHKATVTKPSKGAGEIDKLALSISYFDPYYGTTLAFIQSRKPSTSISLLTLLLPLWSGNYSLTHIIQTHSTVLAVEYLFTVWEQGCTAIFSLSPGTQKFYTSVRVWRTTI